MSTQELIKEITGVTIPEKQDPNFNFRAFGGNITFSISELDADFQHIGGEVAFDKPNPSYTPNNDYQIHRVVDYPGKGVLHYRLCKAMEGSPYEAYMVGWFYYTERNTHRATLQEQINKGRILTKS